MFDGNEPAPVEEEEKDEMKKGINKCQCFARILFVGSNVGLALSAFAYFIAASVLLGQNGEAFVGPTRGVVIFGIVLQFLLALSIWIGLRAYYIKSEMWLIVHAMLLMVILTFSVIGAIFVTVLGDQLSKTSGGFNGLVADIETNFIIQVFNDCCNPATPEPPLDDAFSWGDIVPDKLCELLENVEEDSKVGNDEDSCGGAAEDFAVFEADFQDFSRDFYTVSMFFTWTQTTFMLLDVLVSFRYICCVPLRKENIQNKPVNKEEEEDIEPMWTNEKNAIVPDSVINYISRASEAFKRTPMQKNAAEGPPMPPRPRGKFGRLSFGRKHDSNQPAAPPKQRQSNMPSMGALSKKFKKTLKRAEAPSLPKEERPATLPENPTFDQQFGSPMQSDPGYVSVTMSDL